MTAQHTCDFGFALCLLYGGDIAQSLSALQLFAHHPVLIGTGCHLGQMADREHLSVASEFAHQAPYGMRHCTTHAGIDFIENEGLRPARLAGRHGNGQRNARELATRGHFAHRARRTTGVAGHQKQNVF